jgi:hypothetical protein
MPCRVFTLIVALLALWAVASGAQTPSAEDQLSAAEAKWAAHKPKAYEFTISPRFCCVIRLRGSSLEPLVFRVDNGKPSLVSGEPALVAQGDIYNTVEKLFTFIRVRMTKRPYRTEIEYDPDFGYPRRVYIKLLENAADDEYGFAVEGFRPVERQ